MPKTKLFRAAVCLPVLALLTGCETYFGASNSTTGFNAVPAAPVALAHLEGLPVIYRNDFEAGPGAWKMTDPSVWGIVEEDGRRALALLGASNYEPPVRSPLNIARIEDVVVSDFTLEVKLKQTGREYGHRDMCIIFGYQDPSHFYYVHMASVADEHANSIFIVNGAPRVSIAAQRTTGTTWVDGVYHNIWLRRDAHSGDIMVFFDDAATPIMIANDKTFQTGEIGFGSFDDTGNVDDIVIRGRLAVLPQAR